MRKTLAILITALLAVIVLASLISCEDDCDGGSFAVITYNGNGASDGSMSPQKLLKGKTAVLSENTYTRTDYVFTGWNTEADGSGTSYSDCAEITLENDLTLYAQWAFKIVNITFDSNNGSGETISQTVPMNNPTALRANTFTEGGHGFACWNTKADGSGTSYSDCSLVTAQGNMTLYAQWGVILTDDYTDWNESTYILNSDVTMNYHVIIGISNVRLILHDGCTLTASYGIVIPAGACLTIDADGAGTGRIEATSDSHAAIGGTGTVNGGAVIINGGIINASSTEGAGIGGGLGGTAGSVTINGGTVTAISINGAGIGGGNDSDGGEVTINGGAVSASSNNGSGIGKGQSGGTSEGTLDSSISLLVSDNGIDWSDYDGVNRKPYMKTANYD